ncbi:MAG: NADP-dependent isocitrate dehydrogenase, partial [Acidimicrobiales bacterium]|nr:NADP-dependent isocitrate dehydrogenase [Acidimicrobiales bacterium]
MTDAKIIYTHTDEAPALATYSFLPIVAAYGKAAGVNVESRDISLAGRILAAFADLLPEDQRRPDALGELGELATKPEANIIKLPNVSASIPQMKAAIAELQADGYALPDYPEDPSSDEQRDALARYDRVKGSAVNPVLREGNSDRRAPRAVKEYARKHPHSMGAWSPDSLTRVATMTAGDFRHNELSATIAADDTLKIELVAGDGSVTVLKEQVPVLAGEVVDATFMSKTALKAFLAEQIAAAKTEDLLFSIHLKATMMKVSDPIMFGHAVQAFFSKLFTDHGAALDKAGADPNNGMAAVLAAIGELPADERAPLEAAIAEAYETGPAIAMVDSDKGITNLHVPSDVIVD